MARPREFEPDDAIEKAMQVFWAHGYEGASLPALLDGMGLTRGSLYKAFKDKRNLFLLVLDRYEAAVVDGAVELLEGPEINDGKQRILMLFESVVRAVADADYRGCLLCTAATGDAVDDPKIARSVQKGMTKMQAGFRKALEDERSFDRLEPETKHRLANLLLTQYIGLRVLARSRLPLGVLDQSVQGLDDVLTAAAK